jgi:hypothetical protein
MVEGLGRYMFISRATAKQLGEAIAVRCNILCPLIQS